MPFLLRWSRWATPSQVTARDHAVLEGRRLEALKRFQLAEGGIEAAHEQCHEANQALIRVQDDMAESARNRVGATLPL